MIFFLVSLVRGLREANTDLQKQLVHVFFYIKHKLIILNLGAYRRKKENFPISWRKS